MQQARSSKSEQTLTPTTKELMVKNVTFDLAQKLTKNDRLFQRFAKINKGFVDEVVLSTIGRNKQNPDYQDLSQIALFGLFKALGTFKEGGSGFSTFAWVVMKNDVKQELKRLNKQRNIVRKKDGTYVFHEVPYETLANYDNSHSDAWESHIKRTPQVEQLRNFDDVILNQVVIDARLEKLSELERQMYHLYYVEGLSVKKMAERMGKAYGTVKLMFFERFKPKFDKIHKELMA